MADYNAILNAEIEPEKPVTTSLMNRLRDNPIAISEGAAGAPRIQTAAIANGAVTAAKLATGTGERDWVLARIAAAAVGAVGTWAMLRYLGLDATGQGQTRSGSDLAYSNADGSGGSANNPPGTWRCMGVVSVTNDQARTTVWLRVS